MTDTRKYLQKGEIVKSDSHGGRKKAKVIGFNDDGTVRLRFLDDQGYTTAISGQKVEASKEDIVEYRNRKAEDKLSGDPFGRPVSDKEILKALPGIGEKTASSFLRQFGDLSSLKGKITEAASNTKGISQDRAFELNSQLADLGISSTSPVKEFKKEPRFRGYKRKRAEELAEKGTERFDTRFGGKISIIEQMKAEMIHGRRKEISQRIDERRKAPKVHSLKEWKNNRASTDFPGVDTKENRFIDKSERIEIRGEVKKTGDEWFNRKKESLGKKLGEYGRDVKDEANNMVPDDDFDLF